MRGAGHDRRDRGGDLVRGAFVLGCGKLPCGICGASGGMVHVNHFAVRGSFIKSTVSNTKSDMTLTQANKLTDAKAIAASINDETKAHVGKGGILRNIAFLLAALSVHFKAAETKCKTLAKYADSVGVTVRDVPRASFSLAVTLRLIGDGAEHSGTVTEAQWTKASVHCLTAASKALNLLDQKQAETPPALDAVEAAGFRENIAAAIRANREDDAKAQSAAMDAEKIADAKAEREAEAAKSPAARVLEAMQALGVAVAKLEKLTLAEVETLATAADGLSAIVAERHAAIKAEADAAETAKAERAAKRKKATETAAPETVETPAAKVA